MKKTILRLAMATTLLAGSISAANAAVYDFVQWTADNGEQGFLSDYTFTDIGSGLELTVSASDESGANAFVYMDAVSNNKPGGMGVCSALDSATKPQCIDPSDDNVSFDPNGREVLEWSFNQDVSSIDFNLGDKDHNSFGNRELEYNIGAGWVTVAAVGGFLELGFADAIRSIDFRPTGDADDRGDAFYIQDATVLTLATVSAVPEASTYALMLSGLGVVGFMVKRRKKA